MNFFSKNRVVFWLLIFLIMVNLTVLITFVVFFSQKEKISEEKAVEKPEMAFSKELSLTPSQSAIAEGILEDYRKSTEPIRNGIRSYRTELLEELTRENADTVILNRCTDGICLLQKQMQKASVKQYMALKKICNSDQCERLSSLYFELYGFQGRGHHMVSGQ